MVRAEVRVDDRTILATGLAAAADLEKAEERAIERALEHLGMQTRPRTNWSPEPSLTSERKIESEPIRRSLNGSFKGSDIGSSLSLSEELDNLEPDSSGSISPNSSSPSRLNKSFPKDLPAQEVSMDLSELIAQTNVEMKRIGWMAKQGQDYLQRTFGKRSRQQLDDDELAEFLEFLKNQPTQMANRRPQAPF